MYKTREDLFREVTRMEPTSAEAVERFTAEIIPYFERIHPRLPEVLRKRYALDRPFGMTLSEIADDLGCCSAMIAQMLKKAVLHYKYDKWRPQVEGGRS